MSQDLTGRVLAEKYELVKLLGQGGMGAVWEARNHLGKRFAVKLLITQDVAGNPDLAQRFFREAKASAAIESEHIVEVYDTGIDPQSQLPFIIMEMLRGEDLEKLIGRVGPLNPMGVARIIGQAATGLSHAHSAGIIHRDIKPANIFMTTRGPGDFVVKILDFGIAKQSIEALSATGGAGLTKTGSMLGTPLYMSPEQARGLKTVDARTDIWSLGMCLYEALTGQTPWGDVDTLGELILSICSRDVPNVQEVAPWVPAELARVVHQALERDIQKRMPSSAAFVDALRPFFGGSSALTPEILVGVSDDARGTEAPRFGAGPVPTPAVAQPAATQTAATFSSTNGSGAETQKKPKSNVAIIAIAAVAVLGIGGFAASRVIGGHSNGEEPASKTVAKPAENPVEKTASEKPTATASEKPTETAAPPATETAPVASTAAPAASTAAPPVVAGKGGPLVKPLTKPSASAAPATSSETVKGRIIRKDL